jgi:hypothetical protein
VADKRPELDLTNTVALGRVDDDNGRDWLIEMRAAKLVGPPIECSGTTCNQRATLVVRTVGEDADDRSRPHYYPSCRDCYRRIMAAAIRPGGPN